MSLTPEQNTERYREYYRRYLSKPGNKRKQFAQRQVFQAIETGILVRPDACETCGAGPTEAHHPDYSKPLYVLWLCRACHKALHRKTHCVHGHEYTPKNTYYRPDGNRFCAECARIRARRK